MNEQTTDRSAFDEPLLPCPFCGSEAIARWNWGAESVECSSCDAEISGDTFAESFAAWNRRASVSSPVAPTGLTAFRNAQDLAERFHEAYERLAPSFGYATRPETRDFDHQSANGRLMVAVCQEILASLTVLPPAEEPAVAAPVPTIEPEGYMKAFYEMAAMLGIEGAQAKSPEQVYAEQVKPALEKLIADRDHLQDAYLNMRDWAAQNGLDTAAGVASPDGEQR